MEYKDYYKTLGVERTATPEQIKQSYRKLARKYHPDVSKEANAEEKFKAVQEAYEVLKDPEKRATYDEVGSNWQGGQQGAGAHWQRSSGFQGFGDENLSGFSDFFESIFGGGGRGPHAGHGGFRGGAQSFDRRGRDQHAKITISLEEAFRGGNKTIQLEMPEVDARGQVHHKLRTLKITIPAGTVSGQQMRLAKQGLPGTGNGPPGDLYLEIDVQTHPYFTLQGRDVYLTLPLAPWEAALGSKITAPTLGGPVELKISAGSQTGQKLRLKGRGLPGKPHSGDEYVLLQIVTPPAKTESDKALYEKMAKEMPFNPRQSLT